MEIALYYRSPFETGGVEKTMLERGKLLKKLGNQITYIFGDGFCRADMLQEWAKVGKVIRADLCKKRFDYVIYDSIYNNDIVYADNVIQVINNNVISANDDLKLPYNVDVFVCVSEECQRQFKEKFGYDSIVIPNLIDSNITKKSKEEYTLEKKAHNFVIVSRIDQYKGFERVEQFLEQVACRTKDYQLVIVGSNDVYPDYANRLKERFNKYNVVWVGKQDNPYKYMKNADLLIQLSNDESQCMSMIESLLVGTPVLVTDFDTAKKYVTEDRGFVVKKDLSDLDIDAVLNKKFDFKFTYKVTGWENVIKPIVIEDKFFSVIIPNYNNSEWLPKCFDSVLSQTYKNYELIFIDDMSTDNSLKIAKEYQKKFAEVKVNMKILQLSSKRYNGGARNEGIKRAEGDYCICLDSDDWLKHEEVFERLNKFIRNEDVIRTGYILYKGEETLVDIPRHLTKRDLFVEDTVAVWTKVIKTTLLKDTLFDEGTLCEDKVHHYRIVDKMKSWKDFPEATHVWNRTNSNSTSNKRNYKWNSSVIRHIASMYDFINETKDDYYREFVRNRIVVVKDLIDKGEFTQV